MHSHTTTFLVKYWRLLLSLAIALIVFILLVFLCIVGAIYYIMTDDSSNQGSMAAPRNYQVSGITATASEEIPSEHLEAFRDAGKKYDIPWTVIAATAKYDSNFGKEGDKYFRFPSLDEDKDWEKYKTDGNYDGEVKLDNLYDASFTYAKYLKKNGYNDSPKQALFSIYDNADHIKKIILKTEEYTKTKLPLVTGVWPIPGDYTEKARISSTFGRRADPVKKQKGIYESDFHAGIDIAAPKGTPVRPPNSGEVVAASWLGGYGKTVKIRHKENVVTYYAHLSKINVKRHDKVDTGTNIGSIGNTGKSTGPHLHFEVRVSGEPIDPEPWLKKSQNESQ